MAKNTNSNSLLLERDEFDWLCRQTSRLVTLIKPQDQKRAHAKIIKRLGVKFDAKFLDTELDVFRLRFTRTEIRAVEEIVKAGIKVLKDKILPAYDDKVLKGHMTIEEAKPYIMKANLLVKTLQDIQFKVEGLL